MTSTEKNFESCFEACKAAAVRLNDALECEVYVVERAGFGRFVVHVRDEVGFFSWARFADIVRDFFLPSYFGLFKLPSGDSRVGFFVFYA